MLRNYTKKFMKPTQIKSNSLKNYFQQNQFLAQQNREIHVGSQTEQPIHLPIKDDQLALRFCLIDEVVRKRQRQLTARGTFLSKINTLKSNGQRMTNSLKI